MGVHKCHIGHCNVKTKPELLFCRKHWAMVPQKMKDQVWEFYKEGQCNTKRPSRNWVMAAANARVYVTWRDRDGISHDEALEKIPYPDLLKST